MSNSVYFAYPIDRAGDDFNLRAVREEVRRTLHSMYPVVYDPGAAFSVQNSHSGAPSSYVRDVNMFALDRADVLVVLIGEGQVSWGVPSEIERASQRGIPVYIFTDWRASWSQIYSDSNIHVEKLPEGMWASPALVANRVFNTLKDATPVEGTGNDGLVSMPYVLMSDTAREPYRAYQNDAGLDIYVSEDVTVQPGEYVDVPCGLAVQLPEGTWGMLAGRSSTLRKRGLLVNLGVIDLGYRGELFANVLNVTDSPVEVVEGERLAQLIVLPNVNETLRLDRVDELAEHERGTRGFGSSGV